METITLHNQSLLDVAVKITGDASNALQIAVLNGISITDALQSGSGLSKTESPENTDVKNYYAAKAIQPATDTKTDIIQYNAGIDFWEIENDFIIT